MIHISDCFTQQAKDQIEKYYEAMSQKKKTEQSETSFQKVLDAEIERQGGGQHEQKSASDS